MGHGLALTRTCDNMQKAPGDSRPGGPTTGGLGSPAFHPPDQAPNTQALTARAAW